MLLLFALIYSILILLYTYVPPNYLQMIRDFPKWWAFLTYDWFKSHVNVTEGLESFAEERIRVGKEEAGTSPLNQSYDKLQANQDKAQTRQLLNLARQKIHGWITQWKLIMILSTAIQNIYAKVWIYSFAAVNIHPHHRMKFSDWIKKI